MGYLNTSGQTIGTLKHTHTDGEEYTLPTSVGDVIVHKKDYNNYVGLSYKDNGDNKAVDAIDIQFTNTILDETVDLTDKIKSVYDNIVKNNSTSVSATGILLRTTYSDHLIANSITSPSITFEADTTTANIIKVSININLLANTQYYFNKTTNTTITQYKIKNTDFDIPTGPNGPMLHHDSDNGTIIMSEIVDNETYVEKHFIFIDGSNVLNIVGNMDSSVATLLESIVTTGDSGYISTYPSALQLDSTIEIKYNITKSTNTNPADVYTMSYADSSLVRVEDNGTLLGAPKTLGLSDVCKPKNFIIFVLILIIVLLAVLLYIKINKN